MPASVHKAALVLDLFSVERPDWGPTEVASELSIAKSTAHALLRALTRVGATAPGPAGRRRPRGRRASAGGVGGGWAGGGETARGRDARPRQARGAPPGEPLRRDGPHRGMGAR